VPATGGKEAAGDVRTLPLGGRRATRGWSMSSYRFGGLLVMTDTPAQWKRGCFVLLLVLAVKQAGASDRQAFINTKLEGGG
jgi:hypothetical protein